jgi:enoyl-CoA hydratase/carnithine racemase
MDYQEIRCDLDDQVLVVTLWRPERLNAMTARMAAEILDALERADADDSVRAVVFTGAGRAFCAGADLSAGPGAFSGRAGPAGQVPRDGGGVIALRIFRCLKPVIAAVNGPAVGVGATMTLPMDIRLACPQARFGFVFSRRGLAPEAASSWFLPRVVGISKAAEWVYSGRVFGAEEALEAGLVRAPLEEPGRLLDAARRLAHELCESSSAVSVAVSRQLLWRMLAAPHPMEAHRADSRAIFELARGRDAAEGIAAFLEKRPPRFTARVSTDLPDVLAGLEDPPYS